MKKTLYLLLMVAGLVQWVAALHFGAAQPWALSAQAGDMNTTPSGRWTSWKMTAEAAGSAGTNTRIENVK